MPWNSLRCVHGAANCTYNGIAWWPSQYSGTISVYRKFNSLCGRTFLPGPADLVPPWVCLEGLFFFSRVVYHCCLFHHWGSGPAAPLPNSPLCLLLFSTWQLQRLFTVLGALGEIVPPPPAPFRIVCLQWWESIQHREPNSTPKV